MASWIEPDGVAHARVRLVDDAVRRYYGLAAKPETAVDMMGDLHPAGSARPLREARPDASDEIAPLWSAMERARADAELRESEQIRDLALEAAGIGTWNYDLIANVCRFDARAQALYNLSSDQLDHRPERVASVVHPDDTGPMFDAIVHASDPDGDGRYDIDYRIARGDGTYRLLRTWGKAKFEGEGAARRAVRIVGASRDVTEEVAAQDRLAAELRNTQQLQEISSLLIEGGDSDAVYERILDAAMTIMRADFASLQRLDVEADELVLVAHRNLHPAAAKVWERISLTTGSPCGDALQDGKRMYAPDLVTYDPASAEYYRLSGMKSAQSTPLTTRDGRLLGMMSTHWRTAHVPATGDYRSFDVLVRQTADMFEQAGAAKALRARESELALTQEIGQIASVDVELSDPPVGHRSPEYRRLHGLPEERLMESHDQWLARLHPDDREREDRDFRAAVARGDVFESEYRISRPSDGAERWISARGLFERDAAGKPVRMRGAHIDVTERKHADAALRESEERQRLMLELVPALLWSTSPDGQQVDLNERWLAYTGQSVADTQNYGWLKAIHPDELPAVRAAFEHAFATGEPIEREQRVHKAGDGYHWHLVRHVPVRDEIWKIVHWFGAAVDIHESKLAAQALDESERRLQTLIEGVPQLVWRAVDHGQWTWASPQWTAQTGQAEADSHGFGWLDPIHPDDRETAMKAWAGAVERGEFHSDYRVYHAVEDCYRWFQARATPVRDQSGEIVEWLGTSTDVDDLWQMQEQQKVLVAELQHRTRNLMGVVRSTANRTGKASVDFADFRHRFQDRLEALARVQGLLSRLNETERIAFDELIHSEVMAMNGNTERVTLDGPLGIRLRSSMVQTLAMVLHELATNAVKYGALGQPNGRLAISWRMVEPDRRGQPRLRIGWQESGVMMPPPGAAPQGGGQGRELIERALPYQFSAETSLELGLDGVRCTITIPVSASTLAETTNG